MLMPVLLCGGAGTRLWPLSRQLYPKQFLNLADEQLSLLQQAHSRTAGLPELLATIVVCNEEHRFLVAEQLRQLGETEASIVLEPVGRNTAPAVTLAAMDALLRTNEAVLLVLPADHVIRDVASFHAAVKSGLTLARDGFMVTFGIVPDEPETGFGYIQQGSELGSSAFRVTRFVEKPDRETAQAYLDSGDYFWNSGMFMFRADKFLEEIGKLAPDILDACRAAYEEAQDDLDFVRINLEHFKRCRSDSIDYAVMEKTSSAVVVPVDCGWSDVGSWTALWDIDEPDDAGNVCHGDVVVENSADCYLRAESRLLAAVGVENLVVVETADAVLVADADSAQDVKKLVEQLREDDREEFRVHRRVYRPWGSYETLINAERFQVKRIIVNPRQQLSLQMHHHRAEHWIVVKGTARVTCGEKEFNLSEDQSTYIPLGTKHRLVNPGLIPLELIEVQSGSYLGEDDIVRFDDNYGRAESDAT